MATDPVGWTVSGVEVSAREKSSDKIRRTKTDDVGRFEFRDLPAGAYVVQAIKPGFSQRTEPVTIANADVRLDLALELENATEEITVWGAKPDETSVGATRHAKRGPLPECSQKAVAARRGGIIQFPRKITHVAPVYTREAHAFGPGGRVQVRGIIGVDGRMKNLRALTATDLVFVKPVLDAVGAWEFDPKYLDCMPIETSIEVTVNFSHTAPR